MAKHFRTDDAGNFIFPSDEKGQTWQGSEEDLLVLARKGLGYDKGRPEFKAQVEAKEKEWAERDEGWKRKGALLEMYEDGFGEAMDALLNEKDPAKAREMVDRIKSAAVGKAIAKAEAQADADNGEDSDDADALDDKPKKTRKVEKQYLTAEQLEDRLEQRDLERGIMADVEEAMKPFAVADPDAVNDLKRNIFARAAKVKGVNIREFTDKTLRSYGLSPKEAKPQPKATGGTRELSDLGGIGADGGGKQQTSVDINSSEGREQALALLKERSAARGA